MNPEVHNSCAGLVFYWSILFHVYLLILSKVFKAMSTNETKRMTGSFLKQQVNCDLLLDMQFPERSILLRDLI